jgi:hypothetical protein
LQHSSHGERAHLQPDASDDQWKCRRLESPRRACKVSALILFLQTRRVVTTEHLAAHFELGAWTNHRNVATTMSIVMRLLALIFSTTLLFNPARGEDADATLFRESFDDPKVTERGWYDVTAIRLAGDSHAGKSCIEYEWTGPDAKVSGSSAMRRGFEPTNEVFIRYYLKLSKGWGWSGRNYHPHLTHFMTTENGQWHGPAASHLTLYIEPVNGRLRLPHRTFKTRTRRMD